MEKLSKVLAIAALVVTFVGVSFAFMFATTQEKAECRGAGGVYMSGGVFGGASCSFPAPTESEGTP